MKYLLIVFIYLFLIDSSNSIVFGQSVQQVGSDGSIPLQYLTNGNGSCVFNAYILLVDRTAISVTLEGNNPLYIPIMNSSTDGIYQIKYELTPSSNIQNTTKVIYTISSIASTLYLPAQCISLGNLNITQTRAFRYFDGRARYRVYYNTNIIQTGQNLQFTCTREFIVCNTFLTVNSTTNYLQLVLDFYFTGDLSIGPSNFLVTLNGPTLTMTVPVQLQLKTTQPNTTYTISQPSVFFGDRNDTRYYLLESRATNFSNDFFFFTYIQDTIYSGTDMITNGNPLNYSLATFYSLQYINPGTAYYKLYSSNAKSDIELFNLPYPNGLLIANNDINNNNINNSPKQVNLLGIVLPGIYGSLKDVQVSPTTDGRYLLQVTISDIVGVKYVTLTSGLPCTTDLKLMSQFNLIQGTEYNGTWGLIYDYFPSHCPISLDYGVINNDNYKYNPEDFYLVNPAKKLPARFEPILYFTLDDVVDFWFLKNSVDVSSTAYVNSVFFKLSRPEKIFNFQLVMIRNGRNDQVFSSVWDDTTMAYRIDFTLAQRLFTGEVYYTIQFGNKLDTSSPRLDWATFQTKFNDTAKLSVFSTDADVLGPRVISISNLPTNDNIITISEDSQIGFEIQIVDYITSHGSESGFKSGYAVINYLGFDYNVDILSPISGDIYNFTASVWFNVSGRVTSIPLTLKDIVLFDNANNSLSMAQTTHTVDFPHTVTVTNNINQIDNTGPVSQTMNVSPAILDTSTVSRILNVTYQFGDLNSGIYIDPNAYIVVTTGLNMYFNFPVISVLEADQFNSVATFSGELPYGTLEIAVTSLYGVSNYAGFHATILSGLAVSFTFTTSPYIDSSSTVTFASQKVSLYGYYMGEIQDATYTFKYVGESGARTISPTAGMGLYHVLPIPAGSKPFTLQLQTSSNVSNIFEIVPIPTPVSPTSEPAPEPPKCLGDPVCGGSNGECTPNGCKCVIPWIGNDCQSRQIIIPQPNVNNTSPSTGVDYEGELPNGETVAFSTFVSLIEIRELNHNNEVIERYPFTNWIFTNLTTSTSSPQYLYSTSIIKPNQNINFKISPNSNPIKDTQQDIVVTQIGVQMEWFTEATNISFANENIQMLPSTIKYNVNLSPYPFESSLNTLVLVFKASIQLQDLNADSCSYQENGTVSDSDNQMEYVKLQINSQSLYARFIKRAVIDGRPRKISNQILESDTQQQSNSATTLIGVNIPNYGEKAILDPDFSLLVDVAPASDKQNPICVYHKPDNSLTKAQLAGIIIGATVFGIAVVVMIVYGIYTAHMKKKNLANLQKKLDQIPQK
ncbi:EGF-like domain-containing protein [Tieghemostelium lacteum]|uniref:EGF-like domain-containing protein n=1 Tax=Tieghemostelium lacteum TaxID=361077 RepID=A0A151ZJV0_TIELA|nr:EGF-like domain-containing protein [Tieghemostelium lacteum]|eukprot:KYQ94226.1 EGF-like domain-containing protein [Tieghemostelium lacteum]